MTGKSVSRAKSDYEGDREIPSRASEQNADGHQECPLTWQPPPGFYVAFASMSILALAAALGSTSVSIALTSIAADMHLSSTEAFWLGTVTSLSSTVVQPLCAAVSNILGRKWTLTVGAGLLGLGSLLGTIAHEYLVIFAGRCLQGVAIGIITPITEIVVTDIVPLRLRGQWLALISIPWAVGTVCGPLLSGWLTQSASWRWIFAINIPIAVLSAVVSLITLPSHLGRQHETEMWNRVRQFDLVGFLLLSSALTSFLVPIMQARVVYPWNDYHTLVPLIAGVLGLIAFWIFEWFFASKPLIPLSVIRNSSCAITYFCTLLHGLSLWCLLYYLPLYYEVVKGFTTLHSGLELLPETLTLVPASIITGFFITRQGNYRNPIWCGWVLCCLGMGLLCLLNTNTSQVKLVVLNIPVGVGMGMLFGAMGFAVQAAVSPHDLAGAVTTYTFFRSLGSTLGISIGRAITESELLKQLSQDDQLVNAGLTSWESSLAYLRSPVRDNADNLLLRLLEVFTASLKIVWIFGCALCGVALLASLLLSSLPLDVPLASVTDEKRKDVEMH